MDRKAIIQMVSIVVAAMLIVLVAMSIDLVSGLHKAKQRGDFRSSTGLKRTLSKFISYEGGMMISACFDALIYLSQLLRLFRLDSIVGIPVVTCLVGAFLCFVEYRSVREKADEKTKKEFSDAEVTAIRLLSKPENRELLLELLDRSQKHIEE